MKKGNLKLNVICLGTLGYSKDINFYFTAKTFIKIHIYLLKTFQLKFVIFYGKFEHLYFKLFSLLKMSVNSGVKWYTTKYLRDSSFEFSLRLQLVVAQFLNRWIDIIQQYFGFGFLVSDIRINMQLTVRYKAQFKQLNIKKYLSMFYLFLFSGQIRSDRDRIWYRLLGALITNPLSKLR